ncbi:hypothetical protein [Streptomyces sp. NBC_01618]|uniref:hypothetical protein n=1 Tax=Streptomyces sp. NBC_01618 TaxID=2975900 RepID=UPI0038653B34|nr:hypothetical protein OH735_08475 [Streptomyces sp. NBC_01618]
MPDHQPPPPPAGPIPDTFVTVLRHQWAPGMPAPLRRCRFLAALYAAHRLADPFGALRDSSGRPVPVGTIAHASATSETTAARYLAAAVAAGVLAERHPGLLVLVPGAVPDWQAAAAVIDHHHTSVGSSA